MQKLVSQRILRRRKISQKFLRGERVPRADQTLQSGWVSSVQHEKYGIAVHDDDINL